MSPGRRRLQPEEWSQTVSRCAPLVLRQCGALSMLPSLCCDASLVKANACCFPEYLYGESMRAAHDDCTRMQATKGADNGADPWNLAFNTYGIGRVETLVADTVCLGPGSRA